MNTATIGEKTPQQTEAKLLIKAYKGVEMGVKAAEYLLTISKDCIFCEVMKRHLNGYMEIQAKLSKKICDSGKVPKGVSSAENTMLKMGIMAQTATVKNTKILSKMAFQGTNMGVLEVCQIINSGQLSDENINLMREVLTAYENYVCELKTYL